MSFEKQTDLWPAFEEADKIDKAKKLADNLEVANPGKTVGEIVSEHVHNSIEESEKKKREAKTKESLEKYRIIGKPKEEPVEKVLPEEDTETDIDEEKEDPGYELYGRFEQFRK
jgi:hypothetical protein